MSTKKLANMSLTSAQMARKNKLPKITIAKLKEWGACWALTDADVGKELFRIAGAFYPWEDERKRELEANLATVKKITQNGKIKSVSIIDLLELSETMICWEDKQYLIKRASGDSKPFSEICDKFKIQLALEDEEISHLADLTLREIMLLGEADRIGDHLYLELDEPIDFQSEEDMDSFVKFVRNWVLKG